MFTTFFITQRKNNSSVTSVPCVILTGILNGSEIGLWLNVNEMSILVFSMRCVQSNTTSKHILNIFCSNEGVDMIIDVYSRIRKMSGFNYIVSNIQSVWIGSVIGIGFIEITTNICFRHRTIYLHIYAEKRESHSARIVWVVRMRSKVHIQSTFWMLLSLTNDTASTKIFTINERRHKQRWKKLKPTINQRKQTKKREQIDWLINDSSSVLFVHHVQFYLTIRKRFYE